jgi:hypothetical protein
MTAAALPCVGSLILYAFGISPPAMHSPPMKHCSAYARKVPGTEASVHVCPLSEVAYEISWIP